MCYDISEALVDVLPRSAFEAIFSRLIGASPSASSETGKPDSNPPKEPAAEQQH
jgi:hypothetical protein